VGARSEGALVERRDIRREELALGG
jgi:hypothetical protein